jgi:hypothetical protein
MIYLSLTSVAYGLKTRADLLGKIPYDIDDLHQLSSFFLEGRHKDLVDLKDDIIIFLEKLKKLIKNLQKRTDTYNVSVSLYKRLKHTLQRVRSIIRVLNHYFATICTCKIKKLV